VLLSLVADGGDFPGADYTIETITANLCGGHRWERTGCMQGLFPAGWGIPTA